MAVESSGQFLFWLVFGLVVLHGLGSLWLEIVNYCWLKRNRGRVPDAFAGRVDAAEAARAEDYARARMKLGFWTFGLNKGLIVALLLLDGFAWVARLAGGAGWGAIPSGLLFFGILILAGRILSLPFEWYETFRLEERFGFNRTTVKLWIADMAKGLVLAAVLGGGLLAAVLFLLYEAGSYWWLICWAFLFLFSLVMNALYPVLIAPLFNKFTPLGEGSLRERVVALMERCGIRPRGVFVMDAGRRSKHTNAYFTGFGRAKRIVLFDTLLEKHGSDEILAVLAHEAGHWKRRHILKGLALGQAASFALFAVTGWLVKWPLLYDAFGFDGVLPHAGLLLAGIVYGPAAFLFQPLSAWLSRRHEYEADGFARDEGFAEAMAEALIKLHVDNLANLKPHPAYVVFYYSHPPAAARIQRLVEQGRA